MKSTDRFKEIIHEHLKDRATSDELFAKSFAKPGKTIDKCIAYILDTVQKSGLNGFADEEIFSMAVHYYDEDNLKDIATNKMPKVVVNHTIDLSEEEKKQAKEAAIKRAQDEAYEAMRKRSTKPAKVIDQQPSLF